MWKLLQNARKQESSNRRRQCGLANGQGKLPRLRRMEEQTASSRREQGTDDVLKLPGTL
jgi:hypothetical protein